MNGSTVNLSDGQKLLKEVPSHSEIAKEDVIKYAHHLGIRLPEEYNLLWIAKAALGSSVPPPWCAIEDKQARIYFFNSVTKETMWEHPLDSYYRSLIRKERKKWNNSKRNSSGAESESQMSSLADVPPLSTFIKCTESENSAIHFSLLRGEKRNYFISKSCPGSINATLSEGLLQKQSNNKSEQINSELQLMSLKLKEEKQNLKELAIHKMSLQQELQSIQQEVEKFRSMREDLKGTEARKELSKGSDADKHDSECQTDVSLEDSNKKPSRTCKSAGVQASGNVHQVLEILAHRPNNSFSKSSIGHKDLEKFNIKLQQLRQRHVELMLRVTDHITDPGVTSTVLAPAFNNYQRKDVFHSIIDAKAKLESRRNSSDLCIPLSPPTYSSNYRPLPPANALIYNCCPYDSRLCKPEYMPQPMDHAEWMKRLSELRWNVNECKIKQLFI